MSKKVKTARLSIYSNSFLVILKIFAGILSGSVSIISEAIHSAVDLIASFIAFLAVRISDTPPDDQHPYGHGKFENISGVAEALLIFIAAAWIIYEAIHKIIAPTPIDSLSVGIVVMFISAIINIIVSRRLYKVAKETDSIALEADGLHLKTDVYTSVGVGLGIIIIWLTDLYIIDPIIAIIVALLIIKESYNILIRAYSPLLDSKLDDKDIEIIKKIIDNNILDKMSYHKFRTRKAGSLKYVDFHLEVPGNISVEESYKLCNKIENEIENKLNRIEATIHVEPLKTL